MNLTLQEILDKLRNIASTSVDTYYSIPQTEENSDARYHSDLLRGEIEELVTEVETINNQGYTIS